MPALDPQGIPVGAPTPTPSPPPWWWTPRRDADPGHHRRPARGPIPRRWEEPDPGFGRNPGPTFRWPAVGATSPPGVLSKPPVKTPGTFTPPAPPGPGTKEKKLAIRLGGVKGGDTAGRVFGIATELIDFIEALYEAVPEALRPKGPKRFISWKKKLETVWKHVDDIDWNVAFDNLVKNELEDRLIGTLGKGGKRLAQKTGRNAGFTLGPAL